MRRWAVPDNRATGDLSYRTWVWRSYRTVGGVDYGMWPVIRLLCVIISCFGAQESGFGVMRRFSCGDGVIISHLGLLWDIGGAFIG